MNTPIWISIGAGLIVVLVWRFIVHLNLARRIDLKARLGGDESLNESGEYVSDDPVVTLKQKISQAGLGSILFCVFIFALVVTAVFLILVNR